MIFYFSGTGNSLYAAKDIARHSGEELISISASATSGSDKPYYEYDLKENEAVGFVFPIYAWGPPKIVLDFIDKLKLNNYRKNYVYAVATCGGSIGNTMKVMEVRLKQKGLVLNSGYSIAMPNNYIIMGDIDSKETQQKKLSAADATLRHINQAIEQKTGEFRVVKGKFPQLLTGVINPMFSKNAMNGAKFYADDHCTGCGVCAKVCNCRNIQVANKPQWGKSCTQCLACIHYCPANAIQYGKATIKKGRYTNPYISVNEISNH